jgi:hypothetical protein
VRITAKQAARSGKSYTVLVDGVDLSDCCCEADDIAHTVTVFIRTRAGQDVRRMSDGLRMTAVVRGHVTIVEQIGAVGVPS